MRLINKKSYLRDRKSIVENFLI